MKNNTIPLVLEPLELEALLPHEDLLIVDVGGRYHQGHIPGAVHLDYNDLIRGQLPAPGLLPPPDQLQAALHAIGLAPEKHVIAYDDQGNSAASRLLWTLEVVGHKNASLLNGGLAAWQNEGHPIERTPNVAVPQPFSPARGAFNAAVVADRGYVLASLVDARSMLLDARSPAEYNGHKSPSLRNGRIPGAVNLNWLDTIDRDNNLRFKSAPVLNAMLAEIGVVREKEIITYCQTHRRSSHSFVMLRHLGFERIRGYPGSWSEWGNDPALPLE